MNYENYRFIKANNIKSKKDINELSSDIAYDFFMINTDECIYCTDGDKLIGIVTASNLQRFYALDGKSDYINRNFSYISDINFEEAEKRILRIGNIHEIPVVKNGIFMGIIANGESKPEREWYNIRRDNKWMRYGIIKWRRLEIDKLLSQIRTTIYIYPILRLRCQKTHL